MLELSLNTKATLLLAAPLIVGRDKDSANILTHRELRNLETRLEDMGAELADLLSADADQLLANHRHVIDTVRIERLLARGFLLSQAVEQWRARSIWVMSRHDEIYPQTLKDRLQADCPALLYGCGKWSLLDSGGLAVVGSRNANGALVEYTREVGRLAAEANRTLISGGARGIDQAAMQGALESGGHVTGVLSHDLRRSAMRREHRDSLIDERLALISPYDPNAGFDVGNAMRRNKLIYALADAALIMSATLDRGGTWSGATEQLDKLRLTRVYVRSAGNRSRALEALKEKGALPWPNPNDAEALNEALCPPAASAKEIQAQMTFDLSV